jgi:hypothetical protein
MTLQIWILFHTNHKTLINYGSSSYSHVFALPPILNPLLAIPAAPPLISLLHLQSFQTSVVRNSYSPCWVGAFDFTGIPAAPGGKGQELRVTLMHYNTLTPNCPIGTASVNLGGFLACADVGQTKQLTLALRPLPLVEDSLLEGAASTRTVIGQDGRRAEVEVRVTFLGLLRDEPDEVIAETDAGRSCWSLSRTRLLECGDSVIVKVIVTRCSAPTQE